MKSAIERRMEIANLVGVRGKVSVGDLTEYFGVSGATIRTDLRFLESMGHIVRSNGYVILNKGVIANFSAESRSRKESITVGHEQDVAVSAEKSNKALSYSNGDGWEQKLTEIIGSLEQSLFIGAGALTRHWAQIQKWDSGLILTNDIQLVTSRLFPTSKMTVIMPGGIVNSEQMMFEGGKTEENLKEYRVENAIIEVDNFVPEEGFFAAHENDVRFLRTLRTIAKNLILIVRNENLSQIANFWIGDAGFAEHFIYVSKIKRL
ncbi:DeoR family transcriptional regulator [Salmonella enterica]|uniref:DNA-binding transcriptional regulator AgaR n=2 Tax=Salmonella enterica TaxID=28901 RepID=A0A379QU62_SALER|nr:DeoR family transcriptional regulator [Salmonella enterica]ECC1479547.1 DeoR/GlpR transcriptional regulator [Salmonella enterica subsp. salamae]ASG89765.1 transcriptional regulator [Salmonella enterica subsp. salamae serovar 55:k:z39 str. 1315K]ECC1654136.1 DeoR/GlpR transcriptional regulator [Salmonella enterica subsp. salamae]ECD9412583.1 DeoR/GlpR transcriptional regulator [Salmonella enterica subsp. salamae]ECF5929383.1 DeoR/GlpR transcriptional regulator [Salmonella enterica subsp. sal